jgi:hypothetical protein
LSSYPRNKQENRNNTSSHYNLFKTEFALALDFMDFTHTGIKGNVSRNQFNNSRVPNVSHERSDGAPLPCDHEFLFRRDFRNLFLVKIHVSHHSFRGHTPEPVIQ